MSQTLESEDDDNTEGLVTDKIVRSDPLRQTLMVLVVFVTVAI